MNDFMTPILKIVAALVSPRAAIRYVFVATGLLLSWVKLKPLIDPFALPSQISGLACSFIGIGVGTLAAETIFLIVDLIKKKHKEKLDKKQKNEELVEKNRISEEKKRSFILNFQEVFSHYNWLPRKIMRDLCKSDKVYTVEKGREDLLTIEAIEGLFKNEIILKKTNIKHKTDVYFINPLLKDWLINFFKESDTQAVNDYLQSLNPSREMVLKLLEDDGSGIVKVKEFPQKLVTSNYQYSPCIECNLTNENEESFFFEFKDDYRPIFEEITGNKYLDYIECILK